MGAEEEGDGRAEQGGQQRMKNGYLSLDLVRSGCTKDCCFFHLPDSFGGQDLESQ